MPTLGRKALVLAIVAFGMVAVLLLWELTRRPANAVRLTSVSFAAMPGWNSVDQSGALSAFRRSCVPLSMRPPQETMNGLGYAGHVGDWLTVCRAIPRAPVSAAAARTYFESWFSPFVMAADGRALFTGYYQPEIRASRTSSANYATPVYARPRDLVTADLGMFQKSLNGYHIAGRIADDKLVPYFTRGEIDAKGLNEADVLLYAMDPIAVFFMHIQGSGWATLDGGERIRLAYAGQNGRPYTPIGRVLAARGAIPKSALSLQSISAWLHAHPSEARAVMETDQSYVFFKIEAAGDATLGSAGTQGVPLTPYASLAVDTRFHSLGVPIFVDTHVPNPNTTTGDRPFRQLLVAQDTGGAITGPIRGDIYFGSGDAAAAIAGSMKSSGTLYVLLPKSLAAELAPYKDYRAPDE